MSALVFFSGGLDSTVLAWDIATSPERYGIYKENLCGSDRLIMLAYVTADPAVVLRRLHPALAAIRKASGVNVDLVLAEIPREWRSFKNVNSGHVFSSLNPLASQMSEDLLQMPFTPGVHSWLISYAINLLHQNKSSNHLGPQAFFGFQWESEVWHKFDSGELVHNDTSLEYIDSLNSLSELSGSPVLFQAPFLENRMNKEMIVRHGKRLGVPFEHTSSCLRGWMKNCGRCNQCMLRYAALRSLEDVR